MFARIALASFLVAPAWSQSAPTFLPSDGTAPIPLDSPLPVEKTGTFQVELAFVSSESRTDPVTGVQQFVPPNWKCTWRIVGSSLAEPFVQVDDAWVGMGDSPHPLVDAYVTAFDSLTGEGLVAIDVPVARTHQVGLIHPFLPSGGGQLELAVGQVSAMIQSGGQVTGHSLSATYLLTAAVPASWMRSEKPSATRLDGVYFNAFLSPEPSPRQVTVSMSDPSVALISMAAGQEVVPPAQSVVVDLPVDASVFSFELTTLEEGPYRVTLTDTPSGVLLAESEEYAVAGEPMLQESEMFASGSSGALANPASPILSTIDLEDEEDTAYPPKYPLDTGIWKRCIEASAFADWGDEEEVCGECGATGPGASPTACTPGTCTFSWRPARCPVGLSSCSSHGYKTFKTPKYVPGPEGVYVTTGGCIAGGGSVGWTGPGGLTVGVGVELPRSAYCCRMVQDGMQDVSVPNCR